MEIVIDQRIELLTIIQTLCGYWDNLALKYTGNRLFQCKYKDEITRYFEKHKNHGTLSLYNRICNDGPGFDVWLKMILCYSDPPELNCTADYDVSSAVKNPGEFVDSMKKFYLDTDFRHFFETSQGEYEKILGAVGRREEINENAQCIFNYLGIEDKNYNLIAAPLVMGNFGVNIKNRKNERINYIIRSPYEYKDNKYNFGAGNVILWHEISHTAINDLTGTYINHFNIDAIKPPEKFKKISYCSIKGIICEYIVRAITLRMTELMEGKESMISVLNHETGQGFTAVEEIKGYIEKNCEADKQLLKDDNYKGLIGCVINKIAGDT